MRFRSAVLAVVLFVLVAVTACTPPTPHERAQQLRNRAQDLYAENQVSEAVSTLKEAVSIEPDALTFCLLAQYCADMKNQQEAIEFVDKSLALAPTSDQCVAFAVHYLNDCGQYAKTVKICRDYFEKNLQSTTPLAADVWYDFAHALAKTKQYKYAYEAYTHYFDLDPKDPERWKDACDDFQSSGGTYFYSLSLKFAKNFAQREDAHRYAHLAYAYTSAAKRDVFDKFVVYKQGKRSRVSKTFYGVVKEGLREIPMKLWRPLMKSGCKVMVAREVIDVFPENSKQQPRGYRKGATYREVPALYMTGRNIIIVGEYYRDESGKLIHHDDPAESVCHEIGHAYDFLLGDISHTRAFRDAYVKDCAVMAPDTKKEFGYELQTKDHAGEEETFARLVGIIYDRSAFPGTTNALMLESFPRSFAFVKAKLGVT